jgi:hypothetical protein
MIRAQGKHGPVEKTPGLGHHSHDGSSAIVLVVNEQIITKKTLI